MLKNGKDLNDDEKRKEMIGLDYRVSKTLWELWNPKKTTFENLHFSKIFGNFSQFLNTETELRCLRKIHMMSSVFIHEILKIHDRKRPEINMYLNFLSDNVVVECVS